MSKDKLHKSQPNKGNPSGMNKKDGSGVEPIPLANADENRGLGEQYSTDADILSPGIPVRHPNRSYTKVEDINKTKEYGPVSERTTREKTGEIPDITPVAREIPGLLTKDIFTELANFKTNTAISIYLTTHRYGMEVNEHADLLAFKSSIQQVSKKLEDKGWDQQKITRLLEPAFLLTQDNEFWVTLTEGLGVFITEGYFSYVKMPVTPNAHIYINSSFYTAPLVPILASKEYFFLLTISKKQVKLFRVDSFSIQYIPVEGLPSPMDEVLHMEENPDNPVVSNANQKEPNLFGVGTGKTGGKTQVALYFEEADDVIWKKVLHTETAPLLLAGVEYLIPIYKSVSDYKHICKDVLTGNHDYDNTQTLYKKSKEIMLPYFRKRLTKALEHYGNQSASNLVSSSVNDIIPSAYYGRISQLFVRAGEQIWGKFDEMKDELRLDEREDMGGEDLADQAIAKTIANGGEVFILSRDQMPVEHVLAAVFRY